jgi:hypothetical protein
MIRDLSQTIKAILSQPGLPAELAGAQIVFDSPTDRFAPGVTTIDLFLYDIREDVALRNSEPIIARSNGNAITHQPPLRVACSYMITAWAVGGVEIALQEHRLLSQVLQTLSRFPTIPDKFLAGSLAGQEPPLPMMVMHPDGLKDRSELWFALGNRPRPSLTVAATISMPVLADVTGPIVTTRFTGFDPGVGAVQETLVGFGGRVLDQAGHGIAAAVVDLIDAGLRATTDSEGRYEFVRVSTGSHTIRVIASGFQPRSQPLVVPGQPQDYEVDLTPL